MPLLQSVAFIIGAGLQLNDSKPQGPVQWQVVPPALLMPMIGSRYTTGYTIQLDTNSKRALEMVRTTESG